ncbi:helicase-related protein [Sphingomonas sp. LY29]|uniref:helicase-related protein n=1 Tax=Sphingomonas sp. LY29 TaxID=3095341 RepID=UPI002D78FFAD|nr:helicase-related protein [Sphingomonas sp. LY29]WRP24841.1 helicase-related protein [Sphingomonas sp. LY29]
MTGASDGIVRAILGPTNTGKTYLAIERMCAHSSGVIGFPLRLLAREVYDRVVAIKGAAQVALITGEERIVPKTARYFLTTAESMPVGNEGEEKRDFAFAAIDEAQLGQDPERGHVFTDRMLRARGREETLILGSDTLKPLVRKLLPEAEIVSRPRFSTLRYAGSAKLSRLPPRSAIVAFSAEQVYALAEMLRRFKGGSAVVMGALSPATRNAQVAMFQRGEVDYLVATDAIGMGLNMDVTHVAFAGLEKFDGHRDRRLTIPEMAQIAGRAGRHQRDGSFGTLSLGGERGPEFSEEEALAIEDHRFRPLDHLYWRSADLDFTSVNDLIHSLEQRPDDPLLRAAPLAIDLAVLKLIAEDPAVAAQRERRARRLWAVCGLPDFRKVGPMHHARMVRRLYSYIGEGGHIPHEWFAAEVARLDNVVGDIEALADRLAGIRSWAYIAQRSDWLADPDKWAERTRSVEGRLSDALHERLTQRFVDRRTAVLVRDIGARGADALPVTVAADGEVSVGPEPIGHLAGFEFRVDPTARHADKRLLLAAAERRLGDELDRRAAGLCAADDHCFTLVEEAGGLGIAWEGHILARLAPGRSLLEPAVRTTRPLDRLSATRRAALRARLERWVEGQVTRQLPALRSLARAAADPAATPGVRALAAMLTDAGGTLPRRALTEQLAALDRVDRHALHRLKVRLGALDLFVPALLKPGAQSLRAALLSVRASQPMPRLPAAGAATLDGSADPRGAALAYRRFGATWLRLDLADRLATHAHQARAIKGVDPIDRALVTSLGLDEETVRRLMAEVGFVPAGDAWKWRGQRHVRRREPVPARPGNAFAALAGLKR